ncbi:MAG: domain S-box [Pedosphaera sp.]|nr:domain S-box [Pedosphaera sp.]
MHRRVAAQTGFRQNRPQYRQVAPPTAASGFAHTSHDNEYALLFEQNPQPMWVFDRETLNFLAVNQATIRLYGFSREEFLGMTLLEVRPPEFVAPFLDALAATDQRDSFTLASPAGEWKHRKKDGTIFDVEVYCSRTTFNGRDARIGMARDLSECKRAERALQANEQIIQRQFSELQTIYQQAPIGLAFFDRDLRYVKINEQLAAMNGVAVAGHIGRHLRDIVPHLAEVLEPMMRQIIATRRGVENLEVRGQTASAPGVERFWLASYNPVLNAEGEVLGINAAVTETTKSKRVQEQLKARLQQQAAVAQLGQTALAGDDEQTLMDEAMALVTQGLKIELVRVLELLSGDKQMLLRAGIGWKPGKVGHALVPTGNESQAGHTLASGQPVIADDIPRETRFKVLDLLKEHDVQSSITVIIRGSDDDHPYGVLGACSSQLRKFSPDDITFLQSVANVLAAAIQRKRFEEQLGRSEQRFRELADSMPQIIWAARPDGYLDYYNKRWFDYSGLTWEESLAPDGWKGALTPEDFEECRKGWYASVKSGKPFQAEYQFKNGKTGEYRWHLIKSVPVRDEQGHIARWFGSSTDIDEQKRITFALEEVQEKLRHHAEDLEKRVQERTAHLQESLQSLEDVLYHVAHDLRAPLRAMEGLTTLLLEEYAPQFDAEGKNFAERIVASAGRMDGLIRDLLAFGRLGHVSVPRRQVDLEKLLRFTLELLEEEIQAKSATIRLQTPLPPVWANETLLGQVLVNLLSNALKYVPAGVTPTLNIWSESKAETLRLSIQDNGIGIEPEHHQRVFRVFERLHPPEDYPGTGIGLAIVAKSLERMGGRVGLESQPGAGSTFWLELPDAAYMVALQKRD